MASSVDIGTVAFVADYPPRQCGIATFTANLRDAILRKCPDMQGPVLTVTDSGQTYSYPTQVRFEIPEQDVAAYERAADYVALSSADVVSIQHEFGIFGGPYGRHILAFLRELHLPVVTTLHTVLAEPNREQRFVFKELVRESTRVVTMTEKGRELLTEVYGVQNEKIDVIPHGIPDMPFGDTARHKDKLGIPGRRTLLTFGLLSPGKGIENVIKALPKIAAKFPDVVYVILGATHPDLVREQGQTYRLSLQRLAQQLGVSQHVVFFNRFVDLDELKEFIAAADVYVSPYLHEAQVTSGTLAYCFGAGKAVVSTPYWHAKELLSDGRGKLVAFGDPDAIADAVNDLFGDESKLRAMQENAYRLGRQMVWPEVAERYVSSFEQARIDYLPRTGEAVKAPTLAYRKAVLPTWRFDHLRRMTDNTGLIQHAVYTVPNYSHGYCTDDNARALLLMTWLDELDESIPDDRHLPSIYAAFLHEAFDQDRKQFRNFMSYDRRWLEEVGSEDSQGRALWALGSVVGRSSSESLRTWAAGLIEEAYPAARSFRSPRTWAFSVLGLHEYLRRLEGDLRARDLCVELSERLASRFEKCATPDWPWIEDVVAYDNPRICQALLSTARMIESEPMKELALESLGWLMKNQTGANGVFRPVGSDELWRRGEEPAQFDQQPLEAWAAVSACIEAFHSTEDDRWASEARRAFDWFVGGNDLNLPIYDAASGGCRDGLHVDRANANQGAESTLAFLLALAEMHAFEVYCLGLEHR